MKSVKITLIQLFALIVSIVIGTGILNLPANQARAAGQDAWLTILLGGGVVLLLVNLGLLLIKNYPGKNILEISTTVLGNIPGKAVNLLFFLELYLLSAGIIRIFVDFISTLILQRTPIEVLMMAIMITTLYLIYNGLGTIVRFTEVSLILLLPFLIAIFLPYEDWKIINLLPIGSQTFSVYVSAILKTGFAFLGFEVLFFIFPQVQGSMKQKFFVTNLAVFSIIVTYFFIVITSLMAFGVEGLQNEVYSSIKYTGFIRLPILERFEFAMIYFWIFAMFVTFALYFQLSLMSFRAVLPFQENNRWVPLLLMAALRPLALIPQNIAAVGRYTETIALFGFAVIASSFFGLNIISYIKAKLRK